MRTVTPQAAAKLNQRLGTEPMLLLEVEWVDGSKLLYSDQELEGAAPIIVSISGFDTSMALEGSGDSQSVDVTLDDTSGFLKAIYLANDIHKRPASVYLLFKGLDVSHKILLFKGEIVTPITWGETDRTLSFSVMSELKEIPVGFSMEDGDFANIPEEALGKAWPLVFGQVCHMPVAQVRASRRGYLMKGTGIHDFTIPERLCQVINVSCPSVSGGTVQVGGMGFNGSFAVSDVESIVPDVECMDRRFGEICRFNWLLNEQMKYEQVDLDIYNGVNFPQGEVLTLFADGGGTFTGTFNGNTFTVTDRVHPEYEQFYKDNPNQRCRSLEEIALEWLYMTGGKVAGAFNIDGKPEGFQDKVQALIKKYDGELPAGLQRNEDAIMLAMGSNMLGATVARWDPAIRADAAEGFDFANCTLEGITEPGYYQCGRGIAVNVSEGAIMQYLGQKARMTYSTWVPSGDGGYWINTAAKLHELAIKDCDTALSGVQRPSDGPMDAWKAFDDMQSVSFEWIPPGTEMYIEDEGEELYTVSLLPGTVDSVAAYRESPDGRKYLTEVPATEYTVYTTNYTGYNVVEIGLTKPLSRLKGKRWDDGLYVSFTSTVGPNPCDIIQWLVEKYTDKTVDATSFAAVHSYVAKYPCNFYLTERLDVFELINQIAYQSRCSVYVRNDVVYITYLSREPASLRTLTESDILTESFVEELSETEDVYTVHKVAWRQSGAWIDDTRDPEKQLILKYNIPKYGTVEEEWDYFCYNNFDLVLKSATFWLIRKANSWRKVSLSVPIRHIDLDIGDCVTLNVASFGAAVKAIVESISYSPDKNMLDITLWTPIRSGETEPYHWAWPSQKPTRDVWPLPLDTQAGGGYTFTVAPPIGHILRGGYNRFDQIQMSSGDYHPSDLDDALPVVTCLVSDYTEFYESDFEAPEIEAKKLAQSAFRAPMQTPPNSNLSPFGGGGGGGKKKKKKNPPKPKAPVKKDPPEEPKKGSGKGEETGEEPECENFLFITIHTSTLQGINSVGVPGGCAGPCFCVGGCPSCTGPIWVVGPISMGGDSAGAAAAAAQAATFGGMSGGANGMTSGGGSRNANPQMNSDPGFVLETGAPDNGGNPNKGKSISAGWGCGETGVLFTHVTQSGPCQLPQEPTGAMPLLPSLEEGEYTDTEALYVGG